MRYVCHPQIVAALTEVDRVQSSSFFHLTGYDVIEFEAFFHAPHVVHESGLMSSSRIAYRTWNKSQLLHALVSVQLHSSLLARFLFLRFR